MSIGTPPVKGSQQSIRIDTAKVAHELRCATQLDGREWARALSDIVLKTMTRVGQEAESSDGNKSSGEMLGFTEPYV